jgi:hypothetical protein
MNCRTHRVMYILLNFFCKKKSNFHNFYTSVCFLTAGLFLTRLGFHFLNSITLRIIIFFDVLAFTLAVD